MADPTNDAPLSLPVLSSPVAVSTIVSALSQALAAASVLGLKWHLTDDQLTVVVGGAAQLIAILATLYALYKRYTAKVQPLALTQAGADTKAATIVANLPATGQNVQGN